MKVFDTEDEGSSEDKNLVNVGPLKLYTVIELLKSPCSSPECPRTSTPPIRQKRCHQLERLNVVVSMGKLIPASVTMLWTSLAQVGEDPEEEHDDIGDASFP